MIYSLLTAHAALGALINTRIFPAVYDQTADFPGVVFTVLSGTGNPSKREASKMDSVSVQLDVYGSDYDLCINIDKEVRAAMENKNDVIDGDYKLDNIEWNGSGADYSGNPDIFRIRSRYNVTIKKIA